MYSNIWHNRYNLGSRLKTKFRRKLIALQKKNPEITPYSLKTSTLAENWWGKAWNANIKEYIFNKTQNEKGKLAFRSEALADLKIHENTVKAIVLGSSIAPWHVELSVKRITKDKWQKIGKLYDNHLECFEKILDHKFSKDMADLFSNKPLGLFPTLNELTVECTCSSRRSLCKHTAVVLYALGAKIDENPNVLFQLRGVDVLDLISTSIHTQRKNMLKKAQTKSPKVLKDTNLSELFGIE